MNHKLELAAIFASLTLLTGCGALNPANNASQAPADSSASNSSAEEPSAADSSEAESTADENSDTTSATIGAPEKDKLELGYLNSTAHLLAFVAQEEGYFAEEGLNVTLTQFSSAGELVNGLESGKLDVGLIGKDTDKVIGWHH